MASAIAQRLREVLAGAVAVDSLLNDRVVLEGLSDVCLCNLQHYIADADIRSSDPEYRSMQNEEMKKFIAMLEAGASSDQLDSITFLGVSNVRAF